MIQRTKRGTASAPDIAVGVRPVASNSARKTRPETKPTNQPFGYVATRPELRLTSQLDVLLSEARSRGDGLPMAWAQLDESTQLKLKEAWKEQLLRPALTSDGAAARRLLRALFRTEYDLLVERALTQIPSGPGAALPASIQAASTHFLTDVAGALNSATRERWAATGRGPRDTEASPLIEKLINLSGELVRRAQWGETIELRRIQPRFNGDSLGVTPSALQWAKLARAAVEALAGMVKRAEVGSFGDYSGVQILERRDGTRLMTQELYGPVDERHSSTDWTRGEEQQLSFALSVLAHPQKAALRAVWDELFSGIHYNFVRGLLVPALEVKGAASTEAGRRYERGLEALIKAVRKGEDKKQVQHLLGRLGQPDGLPEARRARAVLQLFAAVEQHPGSPGAAPLVKLIIGLGNSFPRNTNFNVGGLATRALVLVARAQGLDPTTLDGLAFDVLSMASTGREEIMRRSALASSGLFDPAELDDLQARVRQAQKDYLANAGDQTHPDVERFLGVLTKQRALITRGLEPPVVEGLRDVVDAAFGINEGRDGERIQLRLDRALPELEKAWQRAPCPTHTLYGAALLDAIESVYVGGPTSTFLSTAQRFVSEVGSAGHHGGTQRYLAEAFALTPRLFDHGHYYGPDYDRAALEPVLNELLQFPADPWATTARVHALLALLPETKAKALGLDLAGVTKLLLQGKEREAKVKLEAFHTPIVGAFVRPPVLEDRVPHADAFYDAYSLLYELGLREFPQTVLTFANTPTAANLEPAREEWSKFRDGLLSKAESGPPPRKASIEIAVNLIDALLAPELDGRWIHALGLMVKKAAEARAESSDAPEKPLPAAPLAFLHQAISAGRLQEISELGWDRTLSAVIKELIESTAQPDQQKAKLATIAELLPRWAQREAKLHPAWSPIAVRLSDDLSAANTAGVPELALHQITGALSDQYYSRSDGDPRKKHQRAVGAFASRFRSLVQYQPKDGIGHREFAAKVLGTVRVLGGSLTEGHPLRAAVERHADQAWSALLDGKLAIAQQHLRQACLVGGSMTFDPFGRRSFEPDNATLEGHAAQLSELSPGDLIRFRSAPTGRDPVACFGGIHGDQAYFTGPDGVPWTLPSSTELTVDCYPSTVALWQAVGAAPGALGSWAHAPSDQSFLRGIQTFGRLGLTESGELHLVAADGTEHKLELRRLLNLEVGLSKDSFLERFFAEHLAKQVVVVHEGQPSVGVLLSADSHNIELRDRDGSLVTIDRAKVDGVQSARD